MIYTNKNNLPEPVVRALKADDYHQDGDISVTGLISPPRIAQLTKRYNNKIEIDVTDRMWILMGKGAHYAVEQSDSPDSLQEERLSCKVKGWNVTGQADLWDNNDIYDYKFTSIWTVIYDKVKPEWEAQLNLYAHLYRVAGFKVDGLRIIIFARDWSKSKALADKQYPQSSIIVLKVPSWYANQTVDFLQERVALHQEAEKLSDNKLPLCTPAERWEKPTTWAVMKEGRKSAVRVLDTDTKAVKYIDERPIKEAAKLDIQKRPGKAIRCEEYCPAAPWCNQYKQMKEEKNG